MLVVDPNFLMWVRSAIVTGLAWASPPYPTYKWVYHPLTRHGGTEGTGNEFEQASHRRCPPSFPTAACGLDGQEQLGGDGNF